MRSKKDKFFVTKAISDIAGLAYEIVRDLDLPEETKKSLKRRKRKKDDSDSDYDEYGDREMIKKNKGVIVKSGDILRLGRVIYKVLESSLDKKK